ncbi:MAG: hypothetical protein Fur0044_48270 [Anaerolineae bacterium]|nr:YIP1 family protein [Anaerolineales bacterium]MCQ3976392.1 hypothetical protein [Anaerolineae bacterium]
MDFAAVFQTWINVLTKPSETTFELERQKPGANLTTAIIWIIAAGAILAVLSAIGALISSFINGGFTTLQPMLEEADISPEVAAQLAAITAGSAGGVVGTFCAGLIFVPIAFLIGSGVHLLIAKLFGGAGSFEEQTYLLATFSAPIMIINGILSLVPILGGCLSIFVFIYQLVLTYMAVKVAHRLGSGQAAVVALGPTLIFFTCIACLVVGIVAWITSIASTAQ